jgi:hypothetical protein
VCVCPHACVRACVHASLRACVLRVCACVRACLRACVRCCSRQVLKDLKRTGPSIPVLHHPRMQRVILRVLFIWGMRHPGSG